MAFAGVLNSETAFENNPLLLFLSSRISKVYRFLYSKYMYSIYSS